MQHAVTNIGLVLAGHPLEPTKDNGSGSVIFLTVLAVFLGMFAWGWLKEQRAKRQYQVSDLSHSAAWSVAWGFGCYVPGPLMP